VSTRNRHQSRPLSGKQSLQLHYHYRVYNCKKYICFDICYYNLLYLPNLTALNVLGHPKETIAVSLLHDNRAHEDLNGAHVLQWDLALTSGLDQTEGRAELLLRDGTGGINLVSEDQERNTLQLLDGKKGLKKLEQQISISQRLNDIAVTAISSLANTNVALDLHPTRP
jgi:hypothetical protein